MPRGSQPACALNQRLVLPCVCAASNATRALAKLKPGNWRRLGGMRRLLLGFAAGLSLLTRLCVATGATGSLIGTVTDPSGAVIVGAAVSATNRATGISRSTFSSSAGDYDIVILQPGRYQVTVSKPGFKSLTFDNIDVDVDQIVRVDALLQVETKTEELHVTDAIPLLESQNTTVGAVVERQSISGLPLNERNFLNFTLLVPGAQLPVAGSNVSVQGGSVIINGARETANTFLIDGVDNNSPLIGRTTML